MAQNQTPAIPMEKRIRKALQGVRKGIGKKELMKRAGVRRNRVPEFNKTLGSMLEGGDVVVKRGRYVLLEKLGLYPAEIVKVTATFGFAKPDKEGERDVFVPGRSLGGAMPGDRVLLHALQGRGGELPEGEVYSIAEERNLPFSGVVVVDDRGRPAILPDRYVRFPIVLEEGSSAKPGEKILAQVTHRGDRHSAHRAGLVEQFGDSGSALVCSRAILRAGGIVEEFPAPVLEETATIPDEIHPKELEHRLDLREEVIFTIDGADTKDIDDAVSLQKTDSGWKLGVHIADVSYYVTAKSELDKEAYNRGTSVYFADRVVPMIPPALSNGICSLNPGVDRLAFSALMTLDRHGNLKDYRFKKTIIRSRVQGVYSEINAIYNDEADEAVLAKYDGLVPMLMEMRELAKVLEQQRFARGSVNLETVESKIHVGPDGKADGVEERHRGEAERLIEEFMLSANEAAATFALKESLPFLFRVHEPPAPDRMEQLYELLDRIGIPVKKRGTAPDPHTIAAILEKAEGTPLQGIVNNMMLRTMSKAKYAAENIGHFGLALDNYTHFTSPIRRYPDLLIHRILSAKVTGMKRENLEKRFGGFVAEAAGQSTAREIAAMTAERDAEDCYKAEYMLRFVGEDFDGVISSVTSFGLFVQLENTVEGLISTADFPPGNWAFDGTAAYTAENRRLALGDKVRVKVAASDVSGGRVTFVFA